MQVTKIPKKTITLIEPQSSHTVDKEKYNQLRVAAYCRVSTDSEEQLTSYTMQKKVYTELIQSKPEWCLAGIYADEGISGTRADKRKEFQRMIHDAYKGKIDYIITKSVSRFARNTADCIEYVRQLKLRGIGVIFEEQNCDTLKCDSELLLTIHAGFAQAESESMSKNITWSVRKRFENGKVAFCYNKTLGYRKGTDGGPEIIPEEAETIHLIFDRFLSGMTVRQIADKLNEEGIETKCGNGKWSLSTVERILKNERYCGDAILQKTVTIDCISKTKKKNTGEAPMYYVRDNHPAIIDRKTFNLAQEELTRRISKRSPSMKSTITGHGRYSRYALSEVLHCGECGSKYKRCTWVRDGKKKIVWRCCSRIDYGTKFCKESPTVDETVLKAAIVRAMSRFNKEDFEQFHAIMRNSIAEAVGISVNSSETEMLRGRIEALNKQMLALVDASLRNNQSVEENEGKYKELSTEIGQLTSRLQVIQSTETVSADAEERVEKLKKAMDGLKHCSTEYSDSAVRQMIECIRVYPNGKLEVIFGGGYTINETIVE
jgi:site-specific DNA recombinase